MACISCLKITPLSFNNPTVKHLNLSRRKRNFTVLCLASSTSLPPINVDYLESEFSGHGVSFTGIGDSCVAKMQLNNGSTASLMIPSGLITSYKAQMWHGGKLEFLHTKVNKGQDGEAIVRGGMSLDFKCEISPHEVPWFPSTWVLHSVRGSPDEFIEVELISVGDSKTMAEVKHVVTLHPNQLSSEVLISNLKSRPLSLKGSFMSHLTVSTPDATYAVGLEGSNYFNKPPLASDFSIIPPAFGQTTIARKLSSRTVLQGILSKWDQQHDRTENKVSKTEDEMEEEEEKDNYVQLTEKMSRIYTSSPRMFTIIDKGRRNSVIVGRNGFGEQYIFSPGSSHEWYGQYAYVCTGPSAMLRPIILDPKAVWRGGQYLHNPNL